MKKIDTYMIVLSAIIIIGFFALLGVLLFVNIKESNQSLVYLATGGLLGCFSNIVGYYFGSSQGSKIKTDMLMEKNNVNNQNIDGQSFG